MSPVAYIRQPVFVVKMSRRRMLRNYRIKFNLVNKMWGLQQDPSYPGSITCWPVVRIQ